MVKLYVLLVCLAACDYSTERAEAHLRSMGYQSVACSEDGSNVATCSADKVQFRCVVSNATG